MAMGAWLPSTSTALILVEPNSIPRAVFPVLIASFTASFIVFSPFHFFIFISFFISVFSAFRNRFPLYDTGVKFVSQVLFPARDHL